MTLIEPSWETMSLCYCGVKWAHYRRAGKALLTWGKHRGSETHLSHCCFIVAHHTRIVSEFNLEFHGKYPVRPNGFPCRLQQQPNLALNHTDLVPNIHSYIFLSLTVRYVELLIPLTFYTKID